MTKSVACDATLIVSCADALRALAEDARGASRILAGERGLQLRFENGGAEPADFNVTLKLRWGDANGVFVASEGGAWRLDLRLGAQKASLASEPLLGEPSAPPLSELNTSTRAFWTDKEKAAAILRHCMGTPLSVEASTRRAFVSVATGDVLREQRLRLETLVVGTAAVTAAGPAPAPPRTWHKQRYEEQERVWHGGERSSPPVRL